MAQNSWRSVVGDRGFASWVRELHGRAGTYSIRAVASKRELKQGRSGELYGALTRHFQRWRGSTRGPTFDRHRVEVLVQVEVGIPELAPARVTIGRPLPIRGSLAFIGGTSCPLSE